MMTLSCGAYEEVMEYRSRFESRRTISSVALVVVVAAGCNDNFGNPNTVFDTSGQIFAWSCYSDGCDAEPEDGLVVTCGGEPNDGYLYAYDRFVEVCPAYVDGGFSSTLGELCRLLACDATSDCPRFDGSSYGCESGLCQRRDRDDIILADEMLALCLADLPRLGDCSEIRDDPDVAWAYAQVEAACGTEVGAACSFVPEGCRAP
jgi:hypothetical protein